MPGTHKKGTNDADANGKKGGSLPEAKKVTLESLQEQLDDMKAIMKRNGWSC